MVASDDVALPGAVRGESTAMVAGPGSLVGKGGIGRATTACVLLTLGGDIRQGWRKRNRIGNRIKRKRIRAREKQPSK